MKRWTVMVAVVAVTALVLSSCGSDKKPASLGSSTTTAGTAVGSDTVSVITTAQLRGAVNDLGLAYAAKSPKTHVKVIVETTTAITKFVAGGTPEIAVADSGTITAAAKLKKLPVGSFGRNLAIIAVPTANPRHVTGLKAFAAGSGVRTAVCGTNTSFGNFSVGVLTKAGVKPAPSTVHTDAACPTTYLKQLAAGTLDAVLLFRNDVVLPKGVGVVTIPDDQNIVLNISFVTVGTSAPTAAFAAFVNSATARHVLTLIGYQP